MPFEKHYEELRKFANDHPQIRQIHVGKEIGQRVAYFILSEPEDLWLRTDLRYLREEIDKDPCHYNLKLETIPFPISHLDSKRRFKGKLIWFREEDNQHL